MLVVQLNVVQADADGAEEADLPKHGNLGGAVVAIAVLIHRLRLEQPNLVVVDQRGSGNAVYVRHL